MKFLKKYIREIVIVAQLVLNILGGTGVIPPVVQRTGSAVVDAAATELSK